MRRRPKPRLAKKALRKTIVAVLKRKVETKYLDLGEENRQLYQNQRTSTVAPLAPFLRALNGFFNCWSLIQKGVAHTERIGDKIQPVGMRIRLMLLNKGDRPNLHYRVLIVKFPKTMDGVIASTENVSLFQPVNAGGCDNAPPT